MSPYQSMMYNSRGRMPDGNMIRNRSGEQYASRSGNPNMPIFNQPRSGAVPGTIGQMQTANQMGVTAPTKPMRIGAPMPAFNTGVMPGTVQYMNVNHAPRTGGGHSAFDAMAAMHPEWGARYPASHGIPATLTGWDTGDRATASGGSWGGLSAAAPMQPGRQSPAVRIMPQFAPMGGRNAY